MGQLHRITANIATAVLLSTAILLSAAMLLAGCGVAETPATGASSPTGAARNCSGPRTVARPGHPSPLRPAPKPDLPVTVTDMSGASITISDTSRILAVDTYGTLGATVYALGLGNNMVGRDVSTGIPALAKLPVVTIDGHQLNAEAILALRPSVVLTDYSIGPLEVQLQLRDSGIPVVIRDDHRTRDTIEPQIQAVADALGVSEAGRTLGKQVMQEVVAAEADVAALAKNAPGGAPRMAFLYVRGSAGVYQWFGKDSGADALIASVDGIDVATEAGVTGYQPLNAEGLVAADPDVFLLMTDGLESVGGVDGLVKIPGIGETTAGRDRCVVDMADTEILGFGPSYPGTVRALGATLYGAS